MSEITITPAGAKVLRAMIVSCGTAGCFQAIRLLEGVVKDTPLVKVGTDAEGHWLMAAFSRLAEYATEKGLSVLDVADVARYFGGKMHIEIMHRISDHAGMGQYLGPNVGLVSHVLLPLTDEEYQNQDLRVKFGQFQVLNPGESGVPCYHLGVVVNVPLTGDVVTEILEEQRASRPFVTAVNKIKGPITPPQDYWEALTCTIKKASTSRPALPPSRHRGRTSGFL